MIDHKPHPDFSNLFYPQWTVEPLPLKFKTFLNDERSTPDDPNHKELYDYYNYDAYMNSSYYNETEIDTSAEKEWNYSDGLIFRIKFTRLVSVFMWQIYMPSLLLCIASTLSVYIPSQIVPGRMSLSVTSFLALVALFGNARFVIIFKCPQDRYCKNIFWGTFLSEHFFGNIFWRTFFVEHFSGTIFWGTFFEEHFKRTFF